MDTINFVLTKSRVSDTKKRRMLHLVQTSNEFSTLESSSWEVTEERKEISRKAISLNEYNDDSAPLDSIDFENYEAAWSVLQAVSMDPTYTKPTAYNLFTLLAQGNAFSKQQPVRGHTLLRNLGSSDASFCSCRHIKTFHRFNVPLQEAHSNQSVLILLLTRF